MLVPATEVHQYTVTIPAGTARAAPYSQALTLDNRQVVTIDLEVPPGPAGLMGFALYWDTVQVIPLEAGQWIVWDGRAQSWDVDGYPAGSGWTVKGYNTGAYQHSIYVRLHTVYPAPKAAPALPPINIVTQPAPSPAPALILGL